MSSPRQCPLILQETILKTKSILKNESYGKVNCIEYSARLTDLAVSLFEQILMSVVKRLYYALNLIKFEGLRFG